jgi:uncharacterized protein (DUF362 family)
MKNQTIKSREPLETAGGNASVSRRRFLSTVGAASAGLLLGADRKPDAGWIPCARAGIPPRAAAVSIVRTFDYDRKRIRKKVEESLDLIGGIQDVVKRGGTVAVKPNLTGGLGYNARFPVSAIRSYWTHPEVVRAVCECVRDAGAGKIVIVEGVYSFADFTRWGYDEVAKDVGAILLDANSPEPYKAFAEKPVGHDALVYPSLKLNPILTECDALVSVAKMKCHTSAGVTHGMKNLIGLLPMAFHMTDPGDGHRSAIHVNARTRLPRVILDVNAACPIKLTVIDGIETTEAGEGPWADSMAPVKPGLLISGKDPVATDAAATAVQGFDPMADDFTSPFLRSENYLKKAQSLGMGTATPSQIEFRGTSLQDARFPFKACS